MMKAEGRMRFYWLEFVGSFPPRSLFIVALFLLPSLCFRPLPAVATVGGETYADGPFVIDDVEDSNLVSETLGRDWVPDYNGKKPILGTVQLSSSTLTLNPGQSPTAAFSVEPKSSFGFVNQGFGIPLPGQVGQSTLDFPGAITSYPALNFLIAYEENGLADIRFQVLLECYPENGSGTFPTVFWDYSAMEGAEFNPVSIELAAPSGLLNNDNSLPIETLLSQTRFLFLFFSATDVGPDASWSIYVDDIKLGDIEGNGTAVTNWALY